MYRIGVDIGGTFTDFVIMQAGTGVARLHKQLTTPSDPSQAVIEGVVSLLEASALAMADVSEIVHGTTLVTNALIERRGSPTGMLVTQGMRDILDIARERRYDLFDLRLQFPEPVVQRHRRRQINERIRQDGVITQPLDLDEVRAATRELVEREDIEALAVCFLNSYANPAHEEAALKLLSREFPDLKISCSASVVPYIREYERWTTTTMNAYVQPVVDRYVQRIESRLREIGFDGQFHIMTSSGGMVTPATARRFPIRLLESGPAAGALMAARVGAQKDSPRILSFDMGGTTAKGALVRNGRPLKKYELEVARMHEFKAGSGLPARAPVVDMIEIGAGGGSIASIDERGLIRVGPKSAGASPGPACYGGGGNLPTLTDANLVLGYLDTDNFLGGRMKLNTAAAQTAIRAAICDPLALDLVRAAWGIHETINEDVARAFRVHASERAFDYRQSAMVGFGGCGPIHAVRIARKLNVPTIILPPGTGVMSAFGLLVSSFSFEAVRSQRVSLAEVDADGYTKNFAPLIAEVTAVLKQAGTDPVKIHLTRSIDMRYEGQGYEVEVAVAEAPDDLTEKFTAAYGNLFSSLLLDEPVEIVNWKVEGSGPSPVAGIERGFTMPASRTGRAAVGSRQVYVPELARMSTVPVYDRYQLQSGATITGPAIIEEQESTLVVGQGDLVSIDDDLNLIVTLNLGSRGMSAIDRISLGIIWDRLIAITDETLNTLVRTSFSANVRESYDLSCTLFDGNARLIAQGSYSVPSFTGTAPETIRAMLERFPPETLWPGDVIATNDPWIGTGHLYDINVMRPVFRAGKIIAYSMSITHLPDIGGLGFSATAKQIYEEGLRIPVCKLVEAGVPNALLLDIVKNNVRVPDQTLGDLHANIACNEVSARLLMEFMEEYKLSSLDEVADQIIESSELALRKAIETIPDGSYHHAIQIEGEREPLTLAIRLDVRGDHIHGDFAGSSPEVNMGINVPLSYAKAFVAYTVKCLLAPNLPNNLGNVRPITVSAPDNCILNAKPPFPTGGRHIIGHFVTPLVMGALAKIVPNAVQADSGMLSLVNVQGRGARGRGISSIYFSSGGFGALDGLDGANAVPSPSNMTGTSIEVWEELTGMTIVSKALRPDSGGNGRNRGGLGQEIVFRNDTGAPLTISCLAGRTEFPAMGYAGGQPGALRTYLIDGQEVHPKGRYQLAPGGILTILEPGGGGFGPPGERARAAIEHDLKMGFVTPQGVCQAYGLDAADPVLAESAALA